MILHEQYSLQQLNTFGVSSTAKYFVQCFDVDDVHEFINHPLLCREKRLILGGGSNILFNDYFDGCVAKMSLYGRHVLRETDTDIVVRFAAGEIWHECVQWAVHNGYGGIENLALIPGSIGASPIQNIGAYGTEICSVIQSVEYFDIESKAIISLTNEQCQFGYRDSIFKHSLKNRAIVLSVDLHLRKNPTANIQYKDVQDELTKGQISEPSINDVFEAVVRIRQRKLPDVSVLGNAGSFFKNPIVSVAQIDQLHQKYPDMPSFRSGEKYKVPAAWLIEQCGYKGVRRGDAGVYEKHALVLVNLGKARGSELIALANEIRHAVHDVFHLTLEIEVNIA